MHDVTTTTLSLILHCAGLLVFLYLTWADATTRRTILVGCSLLGVLVLGEVALFRAQAWPVLARFLRWTLYFQVIAPLALIYGLLVSSRGALDLFGLYFFAFLVLAPALRFTLLSAHGVAEFLANDDPPGKRGGLMPGGGLMQGAGFM